MPWPILALLLGAAPTSVALTPGQLRIYAGRGVVELQGEEIRNDQRYLVFADESARLLVPEGVVPEVIRAPVDRARAEALLVRLRKVDGEADRRHSAVRHRDAMRALGRGTVEQQAEELHALYRSPYRPGFAELRLTETLESAVLGEIALARLGGNDLKAVLSERDTLAASLHEGRSAYSAQAPQRPPEPRLERPSAKDPFGMKDAEYLGSFTVRSGRLVAGDPSFVGWKDAGLPAAPVFATANAWNGKWHAYVRRAEGRPSMLFAFVDPTVPGNAEAPVERELARVGVDSGRMAILDAELRAKPEADDAMTFPLFDESLVLDRGCMSRSGAGDGRYPVLATLRGGKVSSIAVDFAEGGTSPSWQFLRQSERRIRIGR